MQRRWQHAHKKHLLESGGIICSKPLCFFFTAKPFQSYSKPPPNDLHRTLSQLATPPVKMLSGACRRALRSPVSSAGWIRSAIYGPLPVLAQRRLRSRQQLLSTSPDAVDDSAGDELAARPRHLRNIAIIAHVGKYCITLHTHARRSLQVVVRRVAGGEGGKWLFWC